VELPACREILYLFINLPHPRECKKLLEIGCHRKSKNILVKDGAESKLPQKVFLRFQVLLCK